MTELQLPDDFAERYGPWVVIAGASEGIGSAFVRRIAAAGLNCILIARREAPLAALAASIRAETGVECITATIDLAAPDASERIGQVVGDREVGLYVSNAGADSNGSRFLDADIAAWNALVGRNVMTTMQCCHRFGRQMRTRGKGGILLVNSYACYGGGSFLAAYSASKAFELCFAESLWAELRPHNVDVLTLVLGMTDTPAFRALLAESGAALPSGVAAPDDVAALGLAKLQRGPVQNWGLEENAAGGAPTSAADRRARIEMIDSMKSAVFAE